MMIPRLSVSSCQEALSLFTDDESAFKVDLSNIRGKYPILGILLWRTVYGIQ